MAEEQTALKEEINQLKELILAMKTEFTSAFRSEVEARQMLQKEVSSWQARETEPREEGRRPSEDIMGGTTFVERVMASGSEDRSLPFRAPQAVRPGGGPLGLQSTRMTPTNDLGNKELDPLNAAFLHRLLDPFEAPRRPESMHSVPQPQPYDGSVPWAEYLRQFEIIAARSGWSRPEMADMLATSLRGNALSVLGAFPPGRTIGFDELVETLQLRFGEDQASSQARFRTRNQRPKEQIPEFALALQRLATAAFPLCPPHVVDQLVLAQFVDGLRDDQLRTYVHISRPASFNEAVRTARDLAARLETTTPRRVYQVATAETSQQSRPPRRRRRPAPPTTAPASTTPQASTSETGNRTPSA